MFGPFPQAESPEVWCRPGSPLLQRGGSPGSRVCSAAWRGPDRTQSSETSCPPRKPPCPSPPSISVLRWAQKSVSSPQPESCSGEPFQFLEAQGLKSLFFVGGEQHRVGVNSLKSRLRTDQLGDLSHLLSKQQQ